MKNEQKRNILKDILICFAVATLLFFVFRLWILCFLLVIAMFITVILMVFRKPRNQESESGAQKRITEDAVVRNDTNAVFETILRQITERVRNEYPEAKWVWAQSNTQRQIENGEEVVILLNRSGGYRRAKVKIIDNKVSEIEFITAITEPVQSNSADSFDNSKPLGEATPENYELLAYEWVEAHIMELNDRCNEAIGQGTTELLLTAGELPVRESWPSLCDELKCAGLNDAVCIPDGIKIKFLQK